MTAKKKLFTKEEVRLHLRKLRRYERTFRGAQNSRSLGINVQDFAALFGKTVKIINQLNRPSKDYS